MARNGSGTFSLLNNTAYPGVNGVTMTAADWNALLADLATAMTGSLAADGQTPVTGNLAMGGLKLTGLGAGTATGNSLRWEQLFSQGAPVTLASAGTTDIGAQTSVAVEIAGTTTITSFGGNYNGPRFLRFTGALILTHNATTLNLPTAANITTAAGDTCIAYPTSAGTGWNVMHYQRAALPIFSAYQGSSQTINTTVTKVLFQTEETDSDSCFASSRFTPNVPGWYMVNFQVGVTGPVTTTQGFLYKNGSAHRNYPTLNGVNEVYSVAGGTALVQMNGTTDYVEVYASSNPAASSTNSAAATFFQGAYVRSL